MSQLPINPLSPEAQQKIMEQMYLLCGKQVESYHKHRHMGSNSSVSAELARELLESVEYTVNQAGGVCAGEDLEESLRLGQAVLEGRHAKARSMLELVMATAPGWQTECRWEALRYLRHYLERYDHLHLAHRGPDDLFYPILISPPEGILGIDSCLFYLKIMWIENQIMAGVPDRVLTQLWDRLPVAALNQCECFLINGIGKALLNRGIEPLVFTPEEHMQLAVILMTASEEELLSGAERLCQWLDLGDENVRMYVEAVVPQLAVWIGRNVSDMENLFL